MQTQELYQVVIDNLSDGIFMVDMDKNTLVWNDAAHRITGYTFDEVAANSCIHDLLEEMSPDHAQNCQGCIINSTLLDGRKRTSELLIRHKKRHLVPVTLTSTPVCFDGDIVGAMAVFTDNNKQMQENGLANSLAKLVMTDPLTGLPNRRYIEQALHERVTEAEKLHTHLGVLFINLDDFSRCNKEYGYGIGDDMLLHLASDFKAGIRDTDFVGRWGGEEFLGIFETKSPEHLRVVTQKMKQMILSSKMSYNGELLSVTGSIGATLARNGDGPKQLVDRAMALMHVSKISGKNCVTIG